MSTEIDLPRGGAPKILFRNNEPKMDVKRNVGIKRKISTGTQQPKVLEKYLAVSYLLILRGVDKMKIKKKLTIFIQPYSVKQFQLNFLPKISGD